MYEHFYEDTHTSGLWPDKFNKETLTGDRWTPAEAAQILLSQSDNPHQALESFVNEYPKPIISRNGRETISESSVSNASTRIIHSDFVDKDDINSFQGPLTASMLAAASPQAQKQILGECLFPLIQGMYPELAGKITGMLLEIDNSELVHMLEDGQSLKGKVDEAVALLQAHQSKSNE